MALVIAELFKDKIRLFSTPQAWEHELQPIKGVILFQQAEKPSFKTFKPPCLFKTPHPHAYNLPSASK